MKANQLVKKGLKVLEERIKEKPSETFLEFMSYIRKFPSYSHFNQFLIFWQNPNASLVASYSKWKQSGRYVKRGEKGISIVAPYHYKATRKDKDGNMVEDVFLSFRTTTVFDITQTGGKPLPPSPLERVYGKIGEVMNLAIRACPYPVHAQETGTRAGAIFLDNKIVINRSYSSEAAFATLIHEWAHALLHREKNLKITVHQKEVEAEAVSYIVTTYYGLDNLSALDYLKSWRATPKMIRACIKRVSGAVSKIITTIEEQINKAEKENGEDK